MTGKRFTVEDGFILDNGILYSSVNGLCDVLNELYEENQELREINEWLWKEIKEIEKKELK